VFVEDQANFPRDLEQEEVMYSERCQIEGRFDSAKFAVSENQRVTKRRRRK
jgi:hypothetical protein